MTGAAKRQATARTSSAAIQATARAYEAYGLAPHVADRLAVQTIRGALAGVTDAVDRLMARDAAQAMTAFEGKAGGADRAKAT